MATEGGRYNKQKQPTRRNDMKNFKNESAARHGVRVAGLLMAMVLTACGGGGGNPGTTAGSGTGTGSGSGTGSGTGTGAVAAAPTLTLGITDAAGKATKTLATSDAVVVKATVLDENKKPVDAVVAFATDDRLAKFFDITSGSSSTTGTATTDATGNASIKMARAAVTANGAGTITATATYRNSTGATVTVVGSASYTVSGTALAFDTLSVAPTSIQAYGTTTLSVKVLSGSTAYIDQPVNVTFNSQCATAGKATLSTTVPTNTTTGIAQTTYRDNGCGGNDTITVSADGIAKSAAASLTIAPPSAASVQFIGASPSTQSIVIQGQGGNGRTETATLTFKVVDNFGHPLAGKQVNFTTTSPLVTINKASDTTDAGGQVITTVNSGTVATTFRVQATLPHTAANGNPDISTLSDSVVVTTGLPTQASFSMAPVAYNIEGWNVDSNPGTPATRIQVLLADKSGNPVPDGTPIVFQTNMGSVGTSDKGGCNTVNGGCSVDFRAQNPRIPTPGQPVTPCNTGNTGSTLDATRVGLATVCASSTDGINTVFSKIALFFSGGDAVNTTWDGNAVSFDALHPNDLGSVSSSDSKVFQLQLNDVNLNPLPVGTKVEITSMLNGTPGGVVPATVPSVAPHDAHGIAGASGATVAGPQGSLHTFSIAAVTNPLGGCSAKTATFNVTVTAPAGSVTNIPFKLSFTCP